MKITLAKVSYSAALSEETPAFSATVCIDGVPAYGVSNHATGGCDEIWPLKGQTMQQAREAEQRVEAHAKTLPPIPMGGELGGDMPVTAEIVVSQALDAWLRQKDIRRTLGKLKDRVLMVDGGKLYTSPKTPPGIMPQLIERWRQKYPKAIIVNCLNEEAAAELVGQVLT